MPVSSGERAAIQRDRWSFFEGTVAAVVLVLAAVLRLAAARNDLWLDEIWSLDLAARVHRPIEVFTGLHHDNNHYLNTLWLWAVGPDRDALVYRLTALLTGTATVVMAGRIGARRGAATALSAMLLFAVSYVMVVYSSEARGYAAAGFFALAGFDSLERFFASRRWTAAAAFSASAVLGLLSQPIFISFLAAALVGSIAWLALRWLGRGGDLQIAPTGDDARQQPSDAAPSASIPLRSVLLLAVSHAVPWLAFALLYFVDLGQVVIGGGTASQSLMFSYASAMAWTFGTQFVGVPPMIGIAVTIVLCGAALWFQGRESPAGAVFFACAVIVFPLGLAIARGSNVVYPRYFFLSIEFLLLLLSFWLGALWQSRSPARRAAVLAMLLTFCIVNGLHAAALLRHGRGDVTAALQFMADRTPGDVITLGADHNFRVSFPALHIARTAIPGKTIDVSTKRPWSPDGPEWYIVHAESFEPAAPYSDLLFDRTEHPYKLAATFPTAPLSGFHWFVYHRQ